MINSEICGTMLAVKDGYLRCPYCGASRLQRIRPETQASQLQVYCRKCKRELIVDIAQGQCFQSQCR